MVCVALDDEGVDGGEAERGGGDFDKRRGGFTLLEGRHPVYNLSICHAKENISRNSKEYVGGRGGEGGFLLRRREGRTQTDKAPEGK
jgi:hypothetical protein